MNLYKVIRSYCSPSVVYVFAKSTSEATYKVNVKFGFSETDTFIVPESEYENLIIESKL